MARQSRKGVIAREEEFAKHGEERAGSLYYYFNKNGTFYEARCYAHRRVYANQ